MNENIKCANCGLDILEHDKICLISCLSYLTGYIKILYKENEVTS